MFAPSLNLDLSKLAQSEEQASTTKKVAAKGSRAKARKEATSSDSGTKKA